MVEASLATPLAAVAFTSITYRPAVLMALNECWPALWEGLALASAVQVDASVPVQRSRRRL